MLMQYACPDRVPRCTGSPVRGRILVVDDEPEICALIEDSLGWLGHEVTTAASLPEALDSLGTGSFDVVVTDLRLGPGSGLDLLSEVRRGSPRTRTILISAHADARVAATAIDRGIDYLIVKPFEPADLQARVGESLARRRAEEEAEEQRERLRAQLLEHEERTEGWVRRAAHALSSAVEAKDTYTAGHAQRVTAYALAIAEEIGGIDLESFRLACDLHDVGKIGIPDAVLNRPDRLSEAEFRLVTSHPDTGARILRPLIDDERVLGAVRWHHERWDGQGYPDGLEGEQIPRAARVLALADTLDAITSSRAYREAQPWQGAVDEIRRCSGSQFDPAIVDAFERIQGQLAMMCERLNAGAPECRTG
jgi:putative two-component system response regulator